MGAAAHSVVQRDEFAVFGVFADLGVWADSEVDD